MKKCLIFLLTIILTFSICGCSDDEQGVEFRKKKLNSVAPLDMPLASDDIFLLPSGYKSNSSASASSKAETSSKPAVSSNIVTSNTTTSYEIIDRNNFYYPLGTFSGNVYKNYRLGFQFELPKGYDTLDISYQGQTRVLLEELDDVAEFTAYGPKTGDYIELRAVYFDHKPSLDDLYERVHYISGYIITPNAENSKTHNFNGNTYIEAEGYGMHYFVGGYNNVLVELTSDIKIDIRPVE